MYLTDLSTQFPLQIIRDGQFDSTGSFTRTNPNILVFVTNENDCALIAKKDNISAVITTDLLATRIHEKCGLATTSDPERTYYAIHNFLVDSNLFRKQFLSKIDPSANIHHSAIISPENVIIGPDCRIGPNSVILKNSTIESGIIIGPNCTIGGEGFRFIRRENEIIPIKHAGGVLIHKNVEIQANTCIDKALYGDDTIIGEGTKIDNLVHIGHNVKIGKNCLIVANAMIGGSAQIGDEVWIGPSSAISNGLEIGDRAYIIMGSVVTRNVPMDKMIWNNSVVDKEKFINFFQSS